MNELLCSKWWKDDELNEYAPLSLLLADASIDEGNVETINNLIEQSEQGTKFKIIIEKVD